MRKKNTLLHTNDRSIAPRFEVPPLPPLRSYASRNEFSITVVTTRLSFPSSRRSRRYISNDQGT